MIALLKFLIWNQFQMIIIPLTFDPNFAAHNSSPLKATHQMINRILFKFANKISRNHFLFCPITATVPFAESELSFKCWCSTWPTDRPATDSTDATVAFTTVLSTAECRLCGCRSTTSTICHQSGSRCDTLHRYVTHAKCNQCPKCSIVNQLECSLQLNIVFVFAIGIFYRNGSHTSRYATILWCCTVGHVSSQLDTTAKLAAATKATIDTITTSRWKSTTLSGLYYTFTIIRLDGFAFRFIVNNNILNELYVAFS